MSQLNGINSDIKVPVTRPAERYGRGMLTGRAAGRPASGLTGGSGRPGRVGGNWWWLQVGVMLVWAAGLAGAQEYQLNQQELRIARGENLALDFGTVPQKDHTILLDIIARLDSDGLGGSLYFMALALNGQVVDSARGRQAVRLVNKPFVSPVAPDTPYSWSDNKAWRVLYAPDFAGARRQAFYAGDPYQTTLDVTDLTNPAAENRLTISNVCTYSPPAGSRGNHDLVIQSIKVIVKPEPSPMMAVPEVRGEVINRGTPGAGPAACEARLLPGGGVRVQLGESRFDLTTRLSYPRAGYNLLVPGEQAEGSGQAGWQVQTTVTAEGGEVQAAGPDYRLHRKVRVTSRKVEISDQIVNQHPERPLGLLVEHGANLKDLPQATVRLAGNADPAINEYYSPGNPSVYLRLENQGLGLLCEDDVFRNQATLFYDAEREAAGLRTDKLWLPGGGSYTLKWSIYPVASDDYYDFINLVRHDWGSNYTVEGPWTFFYNPDAILAVPVEELRAQFQKLGLRYACYCGGWVDPRHDPGRIGFGTGVLDPYWADFRGRLRDAAARIREAAPGCKVLIYYDSQRDTSEGGAERFQDSWLTNEQGQQLTTEWGGRYSLTHSVVATLDNSFGQAMLQAVDRYMDELEPDGLYWDEMEGVSYGNPLITYNMADGYSCQLNPQTLEIEREIGLTTLLGEGHRKAVINRVRARGGTMMGNGPTCTRGLLELNPQRMVEIQHNDYWCFEGNLDSPLGYASGRMDFGNWIRALRLATLLVGTRHTYEHEISPYVFPFTPIELHSGYLSGRERIITLHEGNYGWPGERCLVQVRHFDTEGKLTGRDYPTRVRDEARTAVTPAEGEVVVLVRLPVTLQPGNDEATVSAVSYGAQGLQLRVQSAGGATLEVQNGELPLVADQQWTVQAGEQTVAAKVDQQGKLMVTVPPGDMTVVVRPAGP
jgi:hypothetical protein